MTTTTSPRPPFANAVAARAVGDSFASPPVGPLLARRALSLIAPVLLIAFGFITGSTLGAVGFVWGYLMFVWGYLMLTRSLATFAVAAAVRREREARLRAIGPEAREILQSRIPLAD